MTIVNATVELRQRKSGSKASDECNKAPPPPPAQSFASKMLTRVAAGFVMLGLFSYLLYLGHLAVCCAIALFQFGIFRELVNLRFLEAKERDMPLFRSLQWAWFVVAMSYAYGSSWLKAPMGFIDTLNLINSSLPSFITDSYYLMNAVVFLMYSAVFVATVMTLKAGLYEYQLTQLSWTLLTLVLVVAQLKTAAYSIYQGLFWLVFPASLVVANDSFAYFSGVSFKGMLTKRQFMKLSPNKTWEGFLGALVLTLMYAYYSPLWWGRWAWLRCSFPELEAAVSPASLDALGSCRNDWLFTTPLSFSRTAGLLPIQLLAMGLALFASLVAPFGGFFASAVKRAFRIKDFAGFIPGHGGFTDRLDCQLIMSLATWVVYTTFVSPQLQLPLSQVLAATQQLSEVDRMHLLQILGGCPTPGP